MIFTIGVILFVIGKGILAMHLSVLSIGLVSTGAKVGLVLAIAGFVLILFSCLTLAWEYLP